MYVLYCTVVSFCLWYSSEQLSLLLDAHDCCELSFCFAVLNASICLIELQFQITCVSRILPSVACFCRILPKCIKDHIWMTIRSGIIAYIFSFLCLYFFAFMELWVYDLRFQLPVFPGAWSCNYEHLLFVMLQNLVCL